MAKMIGSGIVQAGDVIGYIFGQNGQMEKGVELRVEDALRIGSRKQKN